MRTIKNDYIECQCDSAEHVLRFVIDNEEDEVYLEVQLSQYRNFLKRIWVAIKYIFGYTCKYGHWDVTLIKNEDRDRIIKILQRRK